MNFGSTDKAWRWGQKGWALHFDTLRENQRLVSENRTLRRRCRTLASDKQMLIEQFVEQDLETMRDPDLDRFSKLRRDALRRIDDRKSTAGGRALVKAVKERIGYVPRFAPRRRRTT
jgi:hypothetical protein